ncbi:MAG: CHC2 zinc finger domain-containing protein [Parafilimonas sp.]
MVTYLEQLNFRPTKVQGNDYWYYSPFHKEHTPSFKVNRKLNVWYDHSLGKGGNLVDFGIAYHQCSVAEFLEKLNSLQHHFSFHQQNQPVIKTAPYQAEKSNPKIQVLEIKNLQNLALKNYFQKRAISVSNAEKYCKEVIVETAQKKFSLIGFKNDSGGFELCSIGDFKSTIAPKDVSFFQNDKPALAVVEGLFDFLSLLEKQDKILPELTNFLVLNSLSFFEKAMPLMNEHERVYLLLDNDTAGNRCTSLATGLSQKFINLSHKYGLYKDLNEWLVKEKTLAPEQTRGRGLGR